MTIEKIACPKCEGNGWIPRHASYFGGQCFRCKGAGKVNPPRKTKPTTKKPAQPRKSPEEVAATIDWDNWGL